MTSPQGIDACQANYEQMGAAIGEATSGKKLLTDLNQACGVESHPPNPSRCTRCVSCSQLSFLRSF